MPSITGGSSALLKEYLDKRMLQVTDAGILQYFLSLILI